MNKNMLLGALTLSIVAFLLGRYTGYQRAETEKAQAKQVLEIEQIDSDSHVETIETEIVRTDGTKEVKTVTVKDTSRHKTGTDQTKVLTDTKTITERGNRDDWTIAVLYTFQTPTNARYGVYLGRRVLGPLGLSIWGLTDHSVGLGVSLQF